MAGKPFPVAGSITPFWRSEPAAVDNHRSTESLPVMSDIVVIGAGYAGASTVHHLLDQCDPSSQPLIVILDARQACSGATGRNGGHLKPDTYNSINTLADRYGVEAAAEVAALETAHVPALESLIQKEDIACDLQISTAIDVQLDESHSAKLQAGYEKLIAKGVESTKNAVYISGKDAESVSRVKGAKGCFTYRAGSLWPYKLVARLLARAVSRGVNLQTNTPVTHVSAGKEGDYLWIVHTTRGFIRAKSVVFASNGYTSGIVPEYQDKIIPVRGICSHIVVPNQPKEPLTSSYAIRFSSWKYDYLIPRPDGSIIVGGARSEFFHDLKSWYNTTDDASLIESASHYFDNYMQRHFHGWENTGAYTDRVWTGIMGYTTDSLPHVGKVPNKPGQFIIAGFNGHGMPQIFLSAKGIAQMVLKGSEYEETGLPRLFKTTQERLDSKENKILDGPYVNARERANL